MARLKGRPRKYPDTIILKSARKYTTVGEWRAAHSDMYHASYRRGIYRDCTAHMVHRTRTRTGTWVRPVGALDWRPFKRVAWELEMTELALMRVIALNHSAVDGYIYDITDVPPPASA